ncbi:MAG: glutamate--tRNA ligase [Actinobacteria bacterium]|nr:glutamate--tRNA ligase [Actinomycetota bacterium]
MQSTNLPRVRFAPSPTGYFHVGSARTALFNWMFARQQGGSFILRIEDTDTERNREEWVTGIMDALHWLGLDPDEGPYRQSERMDLYKEAVDRLWINGYLYACDCTKDDLAHRIQSKGGGKPGYDGYCRDRGLEPGPGRVLRFKVPLEGSTIVEDLIRGNVEFRHDAIEDFVVVKSTGAPLFILANAVDDMDMGITHVIRGEDLLPSTPKGILLWRALVDSIGTSSATEKRRAPLPVFAHLPMLVNERRQKLSKRKDPVAIEDYRDKGFLAVAMRNYLALLGWSPKEGPEKADMNELVRQFRLEDVNHSPAFFDVKKLAHLNGEYIRGMSTEEFVAEYGTFRRRRGGADKGSGFDEGVFRRVAPLVQERVEILSEVEGMVAFLFSEQPPMDAASFEKAIQNNPNAKEILQAAKNGYAECPWHAIDIREVTVGIAEMVGLKLAKAQAPIRVAVTGSTVGLPLFESLEVLGRERTIARIQAALEKLA